MRVHTFCFGGAGAFALQAALLAATDSITAQQALVKELPHVDGYFLVEGVRA